MSEFERKLSEHLEDLYTAVEWKLTDHQSTMLLNRLGTIEELVVNQVDELNSTISELKDQNKRLEYALEEVSGEE